MNTTVARIAAWTSANHGQASRLAAPATEEVIAEAERELGLELPAGLRALYQWTEGGDLNPPLVNNRTLMNPVDTVRVRRMMAELRAGGDFDGDDWWHDAWVPFLTNGAGSHLCWDPAGSFAERGGQPGQVLEFWNRDRDRNIVAPSFDEWLEALADSFDAGLWRYDETGWGVEDDVRESFSHYLSDRFPGYPKRPIPLR